MKRLFLLLVCCCVLCSCSNPSTTEQITESTQQTITALEKTLPNECKTPAVTETIRSIRSQVELCNSNCEQRIQVYKEKNRTLWVALISILTLAGLYIARRVII